MADENLQTRAMGFIKGRTIKDIAEGRASLLARLRKELTSADPKRVAFAERYLKQAGG